MLNLLAIASFFSGDVDAGSHGVRSRARGRQLPRRRAADARRRGQRGRAGPAHRRLPFGGACTSGPASISPSPSVGRSGWPCHSSSRPGWRLRRIPVSPASCMPKPRRSSPRTTTGSTTTTSLPANRCSATSAGRLGEHLLRQSRRGGAGDVTARCRQPRPTSVGERGRMNRSTTQRRMTCRTTMTWVRN